MEPFEAPSLEEPLPGVEPASLEPDPFDPESFEPESFEPGSFESESFDEPPSPSVVAPVEGFVEERLSVA